VKFSQNLAQTAQIADKLTIVRGMTHGEAAHERGTHNMFTGYRPSPAIQFPVDRSGGLARVGFAQESAPICLRSRHSERIRRHRLSFHGLRPI
jgi:hypothetical protein